MLTEFKWIKKTKYLLVKLKEDIKAEERVFNG